MRILNKPFYELELILELFPRAGNVGYAIAGTLLKLAVDVGMTPYKSALNAWLASDMTKAVVYSNTEEAVQKKSKVVFGYEGEAYNKIKDTYIIGIKETMNEIYKRLIDVEHRKIFIGEK